MKHVAVKSLLSVMLSLMMVVVFTPAIAFADEPDVGDVDQVAGLEVEPNDTVQPLIESFDQDLELENEYDVESVDGGLNPVKATDYTGHGDLTVNTPSVPSKAGTGTKSEMSRSSAGTAYWPVTVTAPSVLAISGYYTSSGSLSTTLNVYRTLNGSSLSNPVYSDSMYIYKSTSNKYTNMWYFPLTSAGTYYIGVNLTSNPPSTGLNVVLCVDKYAMATNGSTIKPNKMYGVCTSAANSVVNLKLTAAKTGYLRVYTDEFTSTVLKKADGTVLGSQQSTSFYPTFGVKKSRTYQLSTTLPSYNLSTKGFYVYAKNTAVTNKSGKSKKRAATLKKGKYKKGLIVAGSTKAQWFKFKKTKNGSLKIFVKGATNSQFNVAVYRGGKKVGSTFKLHYNESSLPLVGTGSSGKWYIKVWPKKGSSGWYKVKWR